MRKYFLELFAIGLVDSEGRINTEHMTSDAQITSAYCNKFCIKRDYVKN